MNEQKNLSSNGLPPLDQNKTVYLVTGAAGHLGRTVVIQLLELGCRVRALVLPGDPAASRLPKTAEIFYGDVTDPTSLSAAFSVLPTEQLVVLHAAGLITIATKPDPKVWAVNVQGTQNVVDACCAGAARLVYISSVHALPEQPLGCTITETDHFDPDIVQGAYAKTKAAATRLVLQAAQTRGLHACVVHPSGISGPGDTGRGHITQLVQDTCNGTLTAGVHGGYDFVDVRDVAAGVIAAANRGRPGECYLLTNRYYTVPQILQMIAAVSGRKPVRTFLPLWFARASAPLAEAWYRMKKQPPLYTRYSLYTLASNAQFSHLKADRELGYTTRPMEETLADTLEWLVAEGRIRPRAPAKLRRPARVASLRRKKNEI